ncbi:MAG: hypothetical protein N2314_08595 [Brevinematales bacterium]|nr:hypothetical protein [Brevinematales bacterium]
MRRRAFLRYFWLMMGVCFPLWVWGGPLFHRDTEIREVRTKYFRILYAASREYTVSRLVAMADDIYEEWKTKLGLSKTYPFLVVITPDRETMNGMFTSLPRNTIVLYEYLSDPLLVPSDDALKILFVHELLHAISLSVRTEMWDVLSTVMGDFLSPQYLQLPWWMIEGVTVSGESSEGQGRVNSPSYRAILVQHLVENRFEDYSDVAQMRFGKAGYHYIYGGFFSAYLQKKYGWEKYGALFRESSKRFWPYSFESTFKRVYGIPLEKEWASFRSNFFLEVSSSSVREKTLMEGKSLFVRRTPEGVYLIDTEKEKIYRLDYTRLTWKGKGRDIASDGTTTAFRYTLYKEGKPRDGFLLSEGKENTFLPRIREMDILGDLSLRVQVDGFESRLVLKEKNQEIILLDYHPKRHYLFPRFVDNTRAVFVMQVSNRPYLVVLNVTTKEMRLYDFSHYEITSLSVNGDKVWMALYPREGNTLGRLGFFSLSEETLWIATEEMKGGCHSVASDGNILYVVRRFTDTQRCVALEENEVLSVLKAHTEKKEGVSLALPPRETPPSLRAFSNGRRWSDHLPGVRIPILYPEPIPLLFGSLLWNAGVFLYNEDPLQENTTSVQVVYLSPWKTFALSGEWQNRYWYPFSVFVGYGGYVAPEGTYGENFNGGFSYQWDISSHNVVLWRNRIGVSRRFAFFYTSSVIWAIQQGYLSTPYDIFQGPLFVQGMMDNMGNYYGYGNVVFSKEGLSLGLLGGWGNTSFFSPVDTLRGFRPLGETLPATESSYWGRSLYNGVVGAHGFWVLPFGVEAGYKHLPIYFESVGIVLGSYALLLEREEIQRDFYSGYIQFYAKWIVGYILPLTTLWEYQYTSDGWYTAFGIASSF